MFVYLHNAIARIADIVAAVGIIPIDELPPGVMPPVTPDPPPSSPTSPVVVFVDAFERIREA